MSRTSSGFQPGRLVQALEARRLSQVQLAAMVDVSPTTVSKWRNGAQGPEAETLARLASVINVSPEWFTRPLAPAVTTPLFRSNASAHTAARAMMEARLYWAQDIALGAAEFVDFPDLNLPQRTFHDPDQISEEDIEEAAAECRQLWNLGRGPIPDALLAVESAGVVVMREQTGVGPIEGVSAWSNALGRPLVLLSADKDNAFRGRFDVAHELGHLVLHRHIPKATDRERYKLMEKQAHRFAGAFLLHPEGFSNDIVVPVTLDNLLLLKLRWGVSVAAMIMRLEALGLIDEDMKAILFKRRSTRWGAKAEPYDDSRQAEQPRLLRRSIELLISSGVMSLDAVPRHFGLSPTDIQMLAGLREGFFNGSADVVDLATLRTTPRSVSNSSDAADCGSVVQFTTRRSTKLG